MSNYKVTISNEINLNLKTKAATEVGRRINEIVNEDVQSFCKDLRTKIEKNIDSEVKLGYREFGAWQQAKIKSVFKTAVDNFYNAYSPVQYKRTGGLYKVLDLRLDENESVIFNKESGYRELYNESKFHPDRNGGSLFEKVFVEGYHGGAEGIAKNKAKIWGAHPNPGTPYYRKGGFIGGSGVWHKYGSWGRPAVKTKSIYNMMLDAMSNLEGGEILDKFTDVMVKRVEKAHKDAVDSFR